MNWKEFFKITKGKIISTLILFVLDLAIFKISITTCVLGFYKTACFINFGGLLINLIISYLISCLIVYIYSNIKK